LVLVSRGYAFTKPILHHGSQDRTHLEIEEFSWLRR
jgi:hypothetical protein